MDEMKFLSKSTSIRWHQIAEPLLTLYIFNVAEEEVEIALRGDDSADDIHLLKVN